MPRFRGVFMRDKLPRKPWKKEKTVVNMDSALGQGTHWVCFSKSDNSVIYFDPMGNLRPPREIDTYLKGCKIDFNRDRVQNKGYNCGHLCVEFLYKIE